MWNCQNILSAHRLVILAVFISWIVWGTQVSAAPTYRYECIEGKALSGANERTLLKQTQGSCEQACNDWPGCRSFDFGFAAGGVCYLSSAARRQNLVDNPQYLYCEKTMVDSDCLPEPQRYDCRSDRALEGGNDKTYAGQSAQSCAAECTAWGSCRSFDFARSSGICYLSKKSERDGTGTTIPSTGFSYCEKLPRKACSQPRVKKKPIEEYACREGQALSGANDRTKLQQTHETCAAACSDWEGCRSFDFGARQNGVCYLSQSSVIDGTGRTVKNLQFRYCEKTGVN